MALLVHFFDALSQFAFGKLAYAGAKHLFVFREGCQRTRACFFDGNLTLTHCVTLPAGSLWILNRHHNQRAVQKAKRDDCPFLLPLPLGEGWGEGLCTSSFAPSPNPSQREGKKPRNNLFRRSLSLSCDHI